MRLRTLPLSLSGIVMGVALASSVCELKVLTVVFLVLTTIFLQILSNLSNELGDTLHGTDTDEREGIHYSIQDGEMTVAQMKNLIRVIVGLCCAAGVLMLFFSFGTLANWQPLAFIVLGAATIMAAMRYTLGKNPYGYRGLGDFFVFIFFGLVSTMGAFYICSHEISRIYISVLPACSIGFFSVGVLNVNNIRDMKTDALTRTTVAIRFGEKKARIYQLMLLIFGWICIAVHAFLFSGTMLCLILSCLTFPLYIIHIRTVWNCSGKTLDPMLPLLVMSTFAFSLIYGITFAVCS